MSHGGTPSKGPVHGARIGFVPAGAGAAATRTGRRGAVVVGGREFRSNLLPWLALASRERDIVQVAEPADGGWTERILEAVRPGTALVALTEVQSATGARLDLSAVAGRCSDVGALCFVNLTQSAGILPVDVEALGIDFAAAHGYKWLLSAFGILGPLSSFRVGP